MTLATHGHQVRYIIFFFTTSHATTVNMVDVHGPGTADFARNKIGFAITKVIKVNFYVLLQSWR